MKKWYHVKGFILFVKMIAALLYPIVFYFIKRKSIETSGNHNGECSPCVVRKWPKDPFMTYVTNRHFLHFAHVLLHIFVDINRAVSRNACVTCARMLGAACLTLMSMGETLASDLLI